MPSPRFTKEMHSTVFSTPQQLLNFLKANKDTVVEDILPDVIAKCQNVYSGGRSNRNSLFSIEGEVVAIRGYTDKRWKVLIGPMKSYFTKKSSTVHGYNLDSSLGIRMWQKRNRIIKKMQKRLIEDIRKKRLEGNIAEVIEARETEIEEIKNAPLNTGEGFDNLEECLLYLEQEGVVLAPGQDVILGQVSE